MTKLKNLILGLIIVFVYTLYEKSNDDNFSEDIECVKYGTSIGGCLGYCKYDISMITSKNDFNKRGWDLDGLLPDISNSEILDSKYITELMDKINFDSFWVLDSINGCPYFATFNV